MKKIIKILVAVLIPVTLISLVLFVWKVTGVDSVLETEESIHREVVVGEALEIGKEIITLAESNGKVLSIDTEDLNLIVEDTATGVIWQAIDPKGTETEKSLISVNYVGEDNAFSVWDSYTYCVENQSYTMNRIENGVRIVMNICEGASARFYEYMPQKMSVAHYDEVFVAGLERLVEEGTLEKAKATKYKNTLGLIYKKSKETESYNVNFVGQPPKSAVTQLIELSQLVGYTTEMLLADAEEFDFEVEFEEPAIFDITLDVTLEDGELVVNLPVEEIKNGNEFYTLQNIEVLTNFGLVASETVSEGYLFVPDGAGALMKMNSYDPKVPDYVRGFYNNDFYTDYYYKPEYAQELMMPVFGMLSLAGPELTPNGFLAIVESGADTAFLETQAASGGEDGIGRKYNKIYTTYDVAQYEWVPVFGEYSDNTSTFLSIAPQTEEDYTLRYLFYTGDEVSYYHMAKDYQNYLWGNTEGSVYSDRAEVLFETVGTLSLTERFLGIPYDTEYSMTTYEELAEILADMGDRHVNVVYKGVFDGGMNHKLMNQGKLTKTNGGEKELETLIAAVEGKGNSIFLETDFLKIYESGNGYLTWLHGLQDYSKTAVELYGYFVNLGVFKQMSNNYNMLDPQYLVDTVQDFKANAGNYNFYTNDLTEQYYADYGNEYIAPATAQKLIDKALVTLAENGSGLALDNPRADKLTEGTFAVDVSRESSELTSFYTSIPFRQLVMNGRMEYTTTSANNNSDPMQYFLMQAIETGAQPKFTISAKNVDVLKDSTYSYYFSIQYDLLKEEIKEVYDAYAEAMEVIGTTEIVNHTMLDQDVFLTEYADGTKVVTNYTYDSFEYSGTEIPGNDYLILKGGN